MARKKLSKAERERRRVSRERQRDQEVVQDMVATLGCSVETANDLAAQFDSRLLDVDVDLAFARIAHDVWAGRPGHGEQLGPVLAELAAELQRHGEVIKALAGRVQPLVDAEHQHLEPGAVDPDHVRKVIFPPQDDQPVGGQIPTESDGR